MSTPRENVVEAFLGDYAKAVAKMDPKGVASHYGPAFLELGPKGSQYVQNDASYLEAIAQRRDLFRKQLGYEGADILTTDIRSLGDAFWLATVRWQMRFKQTGHDPVSAQFDVTYVLTRAEPGPKILCAISHVDELEAMQELGLVMPQAA